MLIQGILVADRYKLLKLLGKGGFSEVWLGEDMLTNVKVAIKIYAPGVGLDDAGISLFTQEFSLVFDMNHTNLLRPTHYDCWEQMPFLILPYCSNGSVYKYLSSDVKMDEKEAWKLLHDVASGLAYLHGKNPPVIHQDIKPDNILISDEGHYMITDFGISARIRSTLNKKQADMSGGTLAYMGPERFGPTPSPIMASDIWSLGAMMYEVLTGEPPFGNHGGMIQKNGADIPLIGEEYSGTLKNLIYRCVSLNTWDRPTAAEIEKYAEDYLLGRISGTDETISSVASCENNPSIASKGIFSKDNHKKWIFLGVILSLVIIVFSLLKGDDEENNPNKEKKEGKIEVIDFHAIQDSIKNVCADCLKEGDNMMKSVSNMMNPIVFNGDSICLEDKLILAYECYVQAFGIAKSNDGMEAEKDSAFSKMEYIEECLDSLKDYCSDNIDKLGKYDDDISMKIVRKFKERVKNIENFEIYGKNEK